jgi:hypothetical protein
MHDGFVAHVLDDDRFRHTHEDCHGFGLTDDHRTEVAQQRIVLVAEA